MKINNRNEKRGNAQVGEQVDVQHSGATFHSERTKTVKNTSSSKPSRDNQGTGGNVASGNEHVDQQIGIDLSKLRRR